MLPILHVHKYVHSTDKYVQLSLQTCWVCLTLLCNADPVRHKIQSVLPVFKERATTVHAGDLLLLACKPVSSIKVSFLLFSHLGGVLDDKRLRVVTSMAQCPSMAKSQLPSNPSLHPGNWITLLRTSNTSRTWNQSHWGLSPLRTQETSFTEA